MSEDHSIKLEEALKECAYLRVENARLRTLLNPPKSEEGILSENHPDNTNLVSNASSTDIKIALYRGLFRGREDIYALRWEGNNGKSGYAPACVHDWNCPRCSENRAKRSQCENRQFLSLTDSVVHDHLSGKKILGIYPLLTDETCWFLAADFDKKNWREDSVAFLTTLGEMGVPASLERSRSGQGGHVWIFFASPIPASLARKLGCAILTQTMERRHQIGLDSYDRFFPNQDTLPKGGFGNLIALPLQKNPRDAGNSVFLNEAFQIYPDQWSYLSGVRKMRFDDVDHLVREASREGNIVGIRMSVTDEESDEDPWTQPPSKRKDEKPIQGPFPGTLNIVLSNLVYVEKAGLSPAMLNRLMRLAAFQNPEFYKAQAMRLSTYGKPRVIGCGEDFPKHIGLPRGCLEEVVQVLENHNIRVKIIDECFGGNPIQVDFRGELRPAQKEAAQAMLAYDMGVLSATTAFGKTVVAAGLIATRKVNTLILVHRRQLMDQWKERLTTFLDMDSNEIGQIGGGNNKRTGKVDIGILQSLNRKGEVKDWVVDYGQVIVDECHHLSAFRFEQILKQVKARYVLGLTATPIRQDGHHPIIMMQCGPIRFRVNDKTEAKRRPFDHRIIPRYTNFILPQTLVSSGIQDAYSALVMNQARNDLIFDDLLRGLEEGRSPLLLTERTEHIEALAARLKKIAKNVIVLKGGMGRKQREKTAQQIKAIPGEEKRVLIATGRYIGEGFDDARLDTLFLVMPISWRGTLQQYVGRLHRLYDNKKVVQVYDYVDIHVPVFMRMYQKRLKGYQAMGYTIQALDAHNSFGLSNTIRRL